MYRSEKEKAIECPGIVLCGHANPSTALLTNVKLNGLEKGIPMPSTDEPLEETIDLLRRLKEDRFYGSITVKFEAGNVTVLKKEESIKPAHPNYRNNRGKYDNQQL